MLYMKHLRFFQPRRSAASTVSQIAGVKPALRLLSGLTGKCFLMPYAPYNLPLPTSKDNETRMTNLLQENKTKPTAQIAHLVFADTQNIQPEKTKRAISSHR